MLWSEFSNVGYICFCSVSVATCDNQSKYSLIFKDDPTSTEELSCFPLPGSGSIFLSGVWSYASVTQTLSNALWKTRLNASQRHKAEPFSRTIVQSEGWKNKDKRGGGWGWIRSALSPLSFGTGTNQSLKFMPPPDEEGFQAKRGKTYGPWK